MKDERKKFVQLAINRPDKAAKLLRENADKLEKSHTTNDTIKALSKALFSSERTIWRDLK